MPAYPIPANACPADARALLTMRDEVASWLLGRGIRQWVPGELAYDRLEAWIRAGSVHILREGDRLDAAVAVLWDDPIIWRPDAADAGYIHLLMVARSRAGMGLGDAMLTHAEGVIERRHPRARLDAVATNEALHSWYRRRGYHRVGTKTFTDPELPATALFEKTLRL